MAHLDPNAHTPVSRAMRACYKDRNGNEVVPAHIQVINGEWYTVSSLLAKAALREPRPMFEVQVQTAE